MSLAARLHMRYADFDLALDLDAVAGEVLVLLGPNGAGKSTALRALAGLLPELAGSIRLDGDVLHDSAVGTCVPTERRAVGVVFQDLLLFPHLSAVENVAFGLRARGMPRDRARAVATDWLERVGLAAYARSRPGALSGGQAQRVALARALAIEPRLLLLDEPLAALDASTRQDVRADLHDHLDAYQGVTVLVTHDPVDALVLADRLVVVEGGRAVQVGTPPEVALRPRTDYVARLMGLNLLRGEQLGGVVRLVNGAVLAVPDTIDGEVLVAVPPAAVSLSSEPPPGVRSGWAATVDRCEQHGTTVRVMLVGPAPLMADVSPADVGRLRLARGSAVWADIDPASARSYPAR